MILGTLDTLTRLLAVVDRQDFLLPKRGATIAAEIDWLTWFILWVCVIFGGLVFLGTAYIAVRYRHKPGVNDVGTGPTHSTLLEITWSVIPGIIVLLIAIWGFKGYMNYTVAPANAIEIQVEGYKWGWDFTYPNGYTTDQLHVPKDVPVRFVLTSRDVIHSLYLPHFRIKKDAVPGRYNKMWATATEITPMKEEGLSREDPDSYTYDATPATGDKPAGPDVGKPEPGWEIFCTEYCGTKHSKMLARLHVHPDMASYNAWLAAAADIERPGKDGKVPPSKDVGKKVAQVRGCLACHSIDGSKNTGPTWRDLFGNQRQFSNAPAKVADEDYIADSIKYPQKELVQGFGPAMPTYLGKLSDREITHLINYMKSISTNYKGDPAAYDQPLPPEEKKKK